jgi:hypothetical protein
MDLLFWTEKTYKQCCGTGAGKGRFSFLAGAGSGAEYTVYD